MIVTGGARKNSRWFATHLQRTDLGQTVSIAEVRGLAGNEILGWFRQMEAMALGTKGDNPFYHATINPREDETLTREQWEMAADVLENKLGLQGQPRFIIQHEKNDRVHEHIFWSRVDADTGKIIRDSHNYDRHMRAADALEKEFGHEPTPRGRGPEGRNPLNHEVFRGKESGIDPYDVNVDIRSLWRQSDNARAFSAALEAHGFVLARGDRGYVAVDPAGDTHSVARRLGIKMRDVEARMTGDVPLDALPSVEEAKAIVRRRAGERDERQDAPDPSDTKRERTLAGISEELADAIRDAFRQKAPETEHVARDRSPEPELFSGAEHADHAPERTQFERLAEELAQPSKEAAPIPDDVAAVGATEHVLSVFDRVAQERLAALREAQGDEHLFAEGIDWLAERTGAAYFAEGHTGSTPFERAAWEAKCAVRDNGGEPVTADGESFWRRAMDRIAHALERAVEWVKETAQSFVGRLRDNRNTERDNHEWER